MMRFTTSLLLSAALIAAPATAFAQQAPAAPAAPAADAPRVTGAAAGANKASFFASGNLIPLAGVAAVAAAGVLAATLGGGDDETGPPTSTATTTATTTATSTR
ncbi:hypothetical protein CHU95_09320 [Niveispirillum lacus]|uniref:Uncharacterized protein n=1 Tax=Niveispirillum lacus TaxID=1981099 RepID=A0A255YZZ3_9PROT|nr:hypothetical protein [Niveispirillum lacus]OYQ34786.1 hypothetical protein CHU95_09320 [Niveispirillum lacus]